MNRSRWLATGISCWLVALFASASLAAQSNPNRFAGTAGVTQTGGDLEIHFKNKALANQTVNIIAADDDGHETVVRIKLDKNGEGKTTFHVPDWNMLVLEHSTSSDHGVIVL